MKRVGHLQSPVMGARSSLIRSCIVSLQNGLIGPNLRLTSLIFRQGAPWETWPPFTLHLSVEEDVAKVAQRAADSTFSPDRNQLVASGTQTLLEPLCPWDQEKICHGSPLSSYQ